MHKAKELPKEEFKREVERHLTGRDTEPWEIVYFKFYKSQLPVIEQAIETAALMLGSDKSRGYCLEMICADFLAGAHLAEGDPGTLLMALCRLIEFLPDPMKAELRQRISSGLMKTHIDNPKSPRLRLDPNSYQELRKQILDRDGWRCQHCGSMKNLEVHHIQFRSLFGSDEEGNLITLCLDCHVKLHNRIFQIPQ